VGAGFRDYIGADGSADNHLSGYTGTGTALQNAGALNAAVVAPFDMQCNMCHNAKTVLGDGTTIGALTDVQFAQSTGSGLTVTVDTKTAICGQCHSTVRDGRNVATLGAQIATPTDWDAQLAAASNKAVRPHYLGAVATVLGADAHVYAEIPGAIYTTRNNHGGVAACSYCHNPHTGELPPDSAPAPAPANPWEVGAKCGGCHFDELDGSPVRTMAQIDEQRQFGFEADIDGNGKVESLRLEIEGMKSKLVAALRAYSVALGQPDMCFVIDASNGMADQPYVYADTAAACNTGANTTPYNKFTARSLRASFNYMAIQNDPGAWAHNPRYAIEILYDSIADLNAGIVAKVTTAPPVVSNGLRAFNGHFGAADAASKYAAMIYHGGANAVTGETLPPMGFTSAACYQCHGGKIGLDTYLAGMPAAIASIPTGGKVSAFQCDTCHTYDNTDMTGLRSVATVYFPPQKNGTNGQVSFAAANLPVTFAVCGTCHSARENKASVDAKTLVAGTFDTGLVNMHYLGAAATIMGTRTKSWYEYDGKSYTAYPAFWKSGTRGTAPGPHGSPHGAECTGCHQAKESRHTFDVDYTYCGGCHTGPYALAPKEEEFNSMKAELLAALDKYVNLPANQSAFQTGNGGATALGLCYDGNTYGYLLVRKAAGCSTTAAKLDLKSMRAGYNLHWMNKDPGAWAHNEFYAMQLAYDSISDLGFTPSFVVTASSTDSTLNRP
jgi:hypothetical protein